MHKGSNIFLARYRIDLKQAFLTFAAKGLISLLPFMNTVFSEP